MLMYTWMQGLSLALLWFGTGGMTPPLSAPPGPEDPFMAAIAPKECLFYVSWSPPAAPDPASANRTERLMAEAEVRQFFAGFEAALAESVKWADDDDRPGAQATLDLARLLYSHTAAFFITKFEIDVPQKVDLRGGLAVRLDDEAGRAVEQLKGLAKIVPKARLEEVTVENLPCRRLSFGPGVSAVTWCVRGRYLLAGVGEGSLERILKAGDAKPPEWLEDLRRRLPVQRRSSVTYFNLKAFLQQPTIQGEPMIVQILDSFGLTSITTIGGVTGLDGEDYVTRTWIGCPGQPRGLLAVAAGKPLEAKDLAAVPADAGLAFCFRFDAEKLLDAWRQFRLATMDLGNAGEEKPAAAAPDFQRDILPALGDSACIFTLGQPKHSRLGGLAMVVPVKDRGRLLKAHEALVKHLEAPGEGPAPGGARRFLGFKPRVDRLECGGETIYWLAGGGSSYRPCPIAWCIARDRLILSLWPHSIKVYLARPKHAASLESLPPVARQLGDPAPPVILAYADTPAMLPDLYPTMQFYLLQAYNGMETPSLRLNLGLLPSQETLARHIGPATSVVRRTPEGIELSARRTLPGGSVGALGPAVLALLPTIATHREAAKAAKAAEKMERIGRAMAEYASGGKPIPPPDIQGPEGKAVLSWRVLLLPYLGQEKLYAEFHLDEPWHSPHNKTLVAKMPAVYRSPMSKAAGGKTNFLGVRTGKEALRGSDQLREVLVLVQVNDAAAVEWTRPEDFDPTAAKPLEKLAGIARRGFLGCAGDGRVHAIPAAIDAENVGRLWEPGDGRPIDWNALDRPPAKTPKPQLKTPLLRKDVEKK